MNWVLWCWNPFPWVILFQNLIVQENFPSPCPRKTVIIAHSPLPNSHLTIWQGQQNSTEALFTRELKKIYMKKKSSINLLHKYKTELSLTLSVRYYSTQNTATFVSSQTHIYPKYLCKDDASERALCLFCGSLTPSIGPFEKCLHGQLRTPGRLLKKKELMVLGDSGCVPAH